MAEINPTISLTTLKVNGFKNPVIRQRFSDWRKKKDSTICNLQETYFTFKDTDQLKVKGWKEIQSCKQQPQEAILISDKQTF